jgi:hypothetical protein
VPPDSLGPVCRRREDARTRGEVVATDHHVELAAHEAKLAEVKEYL